MQLSEDRRAEIAGFLRARRARLQPEDVGIPRNSRRRTPGLRREEVAALASLSTEWYTWLEQARDVRASADALRRISGALKLEPGESEHLLTLAGYRLEEDGSARLAAAQAVSPQLQGLLDQLEFCPAWVMGVRWDVLAWNEAATVISGDIEGKEGIERNALYQLFLNPRMRSMLVEWSRHARGIVGTVRATYARYVDDPWFNELIEALREGSPEFRVWWDDHDVQPYQDGVKRYDHPEVGRLSFDYTVLEVADERSPELKLVTYVPQASTKTRGKMDGLLAGRSRRATSARR